METCAKKIRGREERVACCQSTTPSIISYSTYRANSLDVGTRVDEYSQTSSILCCGLALDNIVFRTRIYQRRDEGLEVVSRTDGRYLAPKIFGGTEMYDGEYGVAETYS